MCPGKIDGCSQALTQGLRCLVQRGSFAQLRLLNRPAILMLSDDNGTAYQVVLRGLHDDSGSIADRCAERDRRHCRAGALLVRRLRAAVASGDQGCARPQRGHARRAGAASARAARALARRYRTAGLASSDAYDGDLMQLVEQFQRANRLTVDGVAGIETQVALDAALATPDSPLLEPHAAPPPTRGS